MKKNPTAIIGVGNLLMGDEGVGIHAIEYLNRSNWPEDVDLIDAGVPGLSLLHILEGRELSIVIDCADFKGRPGEILVTDTAKLKKPTEELISLHATSLLGTLSLAEKTGTNIGKVILICVQPKTLEMSTTLSPEVSTALPKIQQEVRSILAGNG